VTFLKLSGLQFDKVRSVLCEKNNDPTNEDGKKRISLSYLAETLRIIKNSHGF